MATSAPRFDYAIITCPERSRRTNASHCTFDRLSASYPNHERAAAGWVVRWLKGIKF